MNVKPYEGGRLEFHVPQDRIRIFIPGFDSNPPGEDSNLTYFSAGLKPPTRIALLNRRILLGILSFFGSRDLSDGSGHRFWKIPGKSQVEKLILLIAASAIRRENQLGCIKPL